jgi:hypothetical protein
MGESLTPNIGRSLILVHRIITRGLLVTIERSRAFEKAGFPDPATCDGFASYVRSLTTFLDAHHTAEDEIAFPFFRDRLPDAPYDLLARQHKAMVPLIDHIRSVVPGVTGPDAGGALRDIHRCACRIEEGWHPHFKTEEEHLAPDRVVATMSDDEQRGMNARIGAHNGEHLQPDYLLVPFTLFNLATEDRAMMAKVLPPAVVHELVPGAWKERWQPMAPFLLE